MLDGRYGWLLGLLMCVGVLGNVSTEGYAMSDYRWKSRPFIVFAPDQADDRVVRQKQLVAQSKGGFAERDMVVIVVDAERHEVMIGERPGESAEALRRRFGVPPDAFRSILVGKDGGVKLASGEPISAQTLFSLIDQMPMRLQEMRARPN